MKITQEDGLLNEFLIELREHEYGFLEFTSPTVTPASGSTSRLDAQLQVESTLTLIEGGRVSVALDTSGYTVQGIDSVDAEKRQASVGGQHVGTTFESLTALLSTLSPKFNEKMHDKLCAKLQALADAQTKDRFGGTEAL
ncbi:hypothetical protein GQ54DRAFT_262120 [Martensiomyces pterosporus]|nr:hypothetical protein GQ54DRAFT_262120 [Martensiomyces pterosporus]